MTTNTPQSTTYTKNDNRTQLEKATAARPVTSRRFYLCVLLAVSFAIAVTAADVGDFRFFYDAGAALRQGQSPYIVHGFYSPLHLLIYSLPLSFLPYNTAFRVNAFISAAVLLYVFYRWSRGRAVAYLLLCAAPWLLMIVWYGQIEWLIALASIAAPIPALFLLALKPQLGWLAGLLIAWQLWRTSRRAAVAVCAALLLIYGASFVAGMRWGNLAGAAWNTSIFPLGVILAAPLVAYAVRQRRIDVALAAAPSLSPYVSPFAWSLLLMWASRHRAALIVLVVLSWLLVLAWQVKLIGAMSQ